jgi:hypothetical protein
MNGRIYDPLIGRFLSADPILQDPMNGQSYNRYSYVMNNPTNLTDPTGFAACGETTTGSNIARSCSAEQKATEKIIASGTYVMNNVDGSRTAFVGGKVAMKTDGKGTVLFDAKAPQAASTAVPPQASNDITVVPRSAPISFGLRDKATEKIDDRVAELGSTPVAKTLGGLSRGIASMIPDTPVEAATALVLGLYAKIASLGKIGGEAAMATLPADIAATFRGAQYRSIVLKSDVEAFRFSGGASEPLGRYLTTQQTVRTIATPSEAMSTLNLPLGATATQLNSFIIPKGTTVFYGRVEGGGKAATQLFIQDRNVLMPIK